MAEKILSEQNKNIIPGSSEPRYKPGDYRIEISLDSVRREISGNFPELEISSIKYLSEGMNSTAFIVNGEYVFRFAKHEKADKSIYEESLVMPLVAEAVDLDVPVFEYIGTQESNGHKFVGYREIKGEPLALETLTENPEIAKGLIRQLANFFLQLHSIDLEKARDIGIMPKDIRQYYTYQLEDAREHLYGVIENSYPNDSEQIKSYIENIFRDYLNNSANFVYKPAVIHGDLEAEHIIYDPEKKEVSGVLDWGGIQIGDPDYDLFRPYAHYGKEFIEELLKTYPHENPEGLFTKIEFFYRAQMVHRTVRSVIVGDNEDSAWHLERIRKQALGLGYWYKELREEAENQDK